MQLRRPIVSPRLARGVDGEPHSKRGWQAETTANRRRDHAVNSLHPAGSWAAEINAGAATRAGTARREGLSRARGTQLLGLLELSAEGLRARKFGEITTNEALRRAGMRTS